MKTINDYIAEYRNQLEKGDIRKGYHGIMDTMMKLRIHLKSKHSGYNVSGQVYQGYMDMSYFAFTPEEIFKKKLKFAIVFLHEELKFEIWLAGVNKQVQNSFRKIVKEKKWDKYPLSTSKSEDYAIFELELAQNPDFNDFASLSKKIEKGVLKFIGDIEEFLIDNKIINKE